MRQHVSFLTMSGAAFAVGSCVAEQEVRGSITRFATWISDVDYLLLPSLFRFVFMCQLVTNSIFYLLNCHFSPNVHIYNYGSWTLICWMTHTQPSMKSYFCLFTFCICIISGLDTICINAESPVQGKLLHEEFEHDELLNQTVRIFDT